MLMTRSHACLAVLVAAASFACSDDREPFAVGTGGTAGAGGRNGNGGGAAGHGVSGHAGNLAAGFAGTSAGGGTGGNAGSAMATAGSGGTGSAGVNAGAGGDAAAGGEAGAAGSPSSAACALGTDPEALLVLTSPAEMLPGGTLLAGTAAGPCLVPTNGDAPTLIASPDPASTLHTPHAYGRLVVMTTAPGGHLALWVPGMTAAHITTLAAPTEPGASVAAGITADGKRAVVAVNGVPGSGLAAKPAWLIGLAEGIEDVALTEAASWHPAHRVDVLDEGIVLTSLPWFNNSDGRVQSIANDGTRRIFCDHCAPTVDGVVSAPWIPTIEPGEVGAPGTVILHHVFGTQTREVGDKLPAEAGYFYSPGGEYLFGSSVGPTGRALVRYELSTGIVQTAPGAGRYLGYPFSVSADGRTVRANGLVHFAADGSVVAFPAIGPPSHDLGPIRLSPEGSRGAIVVAGDGETQPNRDLRGWLVRIEPALGKASRIFGFPKDISAGALHPWIGQRLHLALEDGSVELDLETGLHRAFSPLAGRRPIAPALDGASYWLSREVGTAPLTTTYLARAPLPDGPWIAGPQPCGATLPGALLDNGHDVVRGVVHAGGKDLVVAVDQHVTCAVPLDGSKPLSLDADDAFLLTSPLRLPIVPLASYDNVLRFWKPGTTKTQQLTAPSSFGLTDRADELLFAADGHRVLFRGPADGEERWQIYDLDNEKITTLPVDANNVQITSTAIVYSVSKQWWVKDQPLFANGPDGVTRSLCDDCAPAFASTASPFVLTALGETIGQPGASSQARLIHSSTGEMLDVSTKLRGDGATFSDDGRALFASDAAGKEMVRYGTDTGVAEPMGSPVPGPFEAAPTGVFPSSTGKAALFFAPVADGSYGPHGKLRLFTAPDDIRDLVPSKSLPYQRPFARLPFTRDGAFALYLASFQGALKPRAIGTAKGSVSKEIPFDQGTDAEPKPLVAGPGSNVLFEGPGGVDIHQHDLATGIDTVLAPGGRSPVVVENGARLVFEAADGTLQTRTLP